MHHLAAAADIVAKAPDLTDGNALVNNLWQAFGVLIIAGAVVYIIFKFFIGSQKNVSGGIAALVGVAVLAFLASTPKIVLELGKQIGKIIGLQE